jgi:hypothetical protein
MNDEKEETLKKQETEWMNNLCALINETLKNIESNINESYNILTKENNPSIEKKNIEDWKKYILTQIKVEIEKLLKSIFKKPEEEKTNEVKKSKEYKIENNSELNMFTPKDIQEENKKITRNFQNETYKFLNFKEEIENESVAMFFKDVAEISRISFNLGRNIFITAKEKFKDWKKNNNISFEDENIKKEFSCWIKSLEKGNDLLSFYEFFFNQIKLFKDNEKNVKNEYLLKLFYDLTIMYYHCNLAFPLVEINFEKEDDFNPEKMIDFINRGKNRKVNFVILPSLFSFGSFLQNGKAWVFTFYKNTFRFDDLQLNHLNNLLNPENLISNI